MRVRYGVSIVILISDSLSVTVVAVLYVTCYNGSWLYNELDSSEKDNISCYILNNETHCIMIIYWFHDKIPINFWLHEYLTMFACFESACSFV